MKELWWEEAAKYQVLPLNNEPGRFADRRWRRERYEFYPGIGPLPEAIAPNLRNRGLHHDRGARPCRPTVRSTGVIVAHGSHSGGYALLPQGPAAALRLQLRRHRDHGRGRRASSCRPARWRRRSCVTRGEIGTFGVELFYGDVPSGEGKIERRTPVTYGMIGFAVGYQPGGPICPDLDGSGRDHPRRARQGRDRAGGPPAASTAAAELRKDLATQ